MKVTAYRALDLPVPLMVWVEASKIIELTWSASGSPDLSCIGLQVKVQVPPSLSP